MSNAARPNLLRRLMGLPAPVPECDPADMGTAMGLDFCLDESPQEAWTTAGIGAAGSSTQADWLRRVSAS